MAAQRVAGATPRGAARRRRGRRPRQPDGHHRDGGSWGAQIRFAASGRDALRLIAEDAPDLLLSDLYMPEMDGFDLMKRVRELPPAQGGRTPGIAITAHPSFDSRRDAERAGYGAVFSKPFAPRRADRDDPAARERLRVRRRRSVVASLAGEPLRRRRARPRRRRVPRRRARPLPAVRPGLAGRDARGSRGCGARSGCSPASCSPTPGPGRRRTGRCSGSTRSAPAPTA